MSTWMFLKVLGSLKCISLGLPHLELAVAPYCYTLKNGFAKQKQIAVYPLLEVFRYYSIGHVRLEFGIEKVLRGNDYLTVIWSSGYKRLALYADVTEPSVKLLEKYKFHKFSPETFRSLE